MNRYIRYILVGAGGTGSHLIPALMAYLNSYHTSDLDWQLVVVDGDEVEEKNLERQIFSPFLVAMNKAYALVEKMNKPRNMVAINEYLGPNNIDEIIDEGSIVLIAVDNYPVRSLIERHCAKLNDVVVINGGNEHDTGSCQLWIRRAGINETPPISFLHAEIHTPGEDRSAMSCQEVAQLPGGEQLIVANMTSAAYMLTALINYHADNFKWTEIQFDLTSGKSIGLDQREMIGWVQ